MVRHSLIVLSLLLAPAASSAQVTPETDSPDFMRPALTAEQIAAAITEGTREKKVAVFHAGDYAVGSFPVSPGDYTADFVGPYQRVVNAAAIAAKEYRPFTMDDVDPRMASRVTMLTVTPGPPRDFGVGLKFTPEATHVVLVPKDGGGAVQPLNIQKRPVTWGNQLGAEYSGTELIAFFDLETLPTGEFDVVIVHADGEKRYEVSEDDIAEIR